MKLIMKFVFAQFILTEIGLVIVSIIWPVLGGMFLAVFILTFL